MVTMVIAHRKSLGIFFLSAVVLFFCRCAVQHRSIFMCNIGRFGNSQDCVDACPRLNWFKHVKNNFYGPINQSINWTKLPQGSARNSSWLTRAWRKLWYSANNFDTRTLKTNHKAKRWIVLLNMGFSFTVYLKYLAISDETWKHPIWIYLKYIIITITTIITRPGHNPKNHPQQNSRNWRFVLWSITSLPSSWSAMSRGAGLRGPNLGTWRGRFPKFRGLGYGRVGSKWLKHSFFKHFLSWFIFKHRVSSHTVSSPNTVSSNFKHRVDSKWLKLDFRVWSHPLGFTRDSSQ
jgi:hypothetical protein